MTTVEHKGIEVTSATGENRDRWDRFVERSPQGTAFHRFDVLETVAEHTDSRLHPLVGYKGQERVGVFPVFEITRGFVTTVFSPPPQMGLAQLGPALAPLSGMNRRTADKRVQRFLSGCIDWLDETVDPSYVHLRTHCRFADGRPLTWNGFDLTPRYTYVVDLSRSREELLESFSSDARRNVQSESDDRFRIEEDGVEGVERIVSHLQQRHEEQDLDFPVTAEFAADLYRALGEDARTYICTIDGEYASGMITVEDDETIYRWQGGAWPAVDSDVSINDLLDWRIMEDAVERGREQYDLVGANTESVSEYKAKFAPELRTYHAAERGTRTMQLVSELYQRFQ